ncbi:hypothetical protein B0T21DRAFT_348310 [Apiosordaria backusii]|uniref:Uncharacterized protein n=1 Tax=Apiosordaria backusii TaxID=314023 RepID=A0AA40BL44_9PEZI|nr:hypothetical protein B0T21DRAFT_348310 [Apiosordaria backusii]
MPAAECCCGLTVPKTAGLARQLLQGERREGGSFIYNCNYIGDVHFLYCYIVLLYYYYTVYCLRKVVNKVITIYINAFKLTIISLTTLQFKDFIDKYTLIKLGNKGTSIYNIL